MQATRGLAYGLAVILGGIALLGDGHGRAGVLLVVAGGVAASGDVVRRVRERLARRRREASQRRFVPCFHANPVAMSVSAGDRKIIDVNAAYLALFGVRRDDVIDCTPHKTGIAMPQEGEREVAVTTPAGCRRVIVSNQVIELATEPCILSTFVDVTEQRAAREAARASEQLFQELAESLQEVFWLSDPHSETVLYISPAYEKVFGKSREALYANGRDWLAAVHPDDRARMLARVEAPNDEPREEQFRFVRGDGAVRTFRCKIRPILDAGRTVRVAGVGEDVTERLELESQVRETHKLESLGLLAGGVAHDFNNVLAVIGANASLLTAATPDEREIVGEIESAVVRATSLTRQLLAFSRKQVIEPVVLDLNAAVNDTRKMLRRMLGEDISIVTSLEPELGHVLIDPGYLVQVLMNLAVNARDAMPRGGSLEIATRNLVRNGTREVVLSIADTGCGMSAEVQERIFEPFFTTKEVGRGTGLGLSVVHGIVEQAGGRIEVESNVGVGTTMRIILPFIDAPAEPIENVGAAGASGTEKVLVVDDDMFVRRSTSRALRARGYQVLEASDAVAALRLLRDHQEIALLVTDVVMPNVDGRQLAEAARDQRAGLKVLFISGYMDDAVLRHGVAAADEPFLEKPFRGHALAGRVRQLLDAA